MKPCGHVICKICVDKFVRKTKQCFVCDAKCRGKDIADMSGEGNIYYILNFVRSEQILINIKYFF